MFRRANATDRRETASAMFEFLQVNVHGAAGTIVLNRPEKRNAISRGLLAELRQALDDLRQERRVRGIILTGAGLAFCAGVDLEEMKATADAEHAELSWGRDARHYRDLLREMLQLPKPLVAAVNGPVVAAGAGLMLASDIVVAAPEAKFGLPEPVRGLVAGVTAPLLAFRIGAGSAARLLLDPSLIPAEEAHRLGLYHELVSADKLWARSVEIVEQCARGAPEALQLTKRLLNETIGEHLSTLLSAGAAASATARTTEAAAEGLAAFLEKREPNWP